MSRTFKIMTGAAGFAAVLTIASPAAAQQPYPYGNNGGGVVGAIINSVTGTNGQYPQGTYGYGQYPQGNFGYGQVNDRAAVGMCVSAAEQRINATYRGQPGNGYNNGYPNNGYPNNGYGQNGYQYGHNGQWARVLGVTNVERRNNGSLRVTGVASSGQVYGGYGNQGYGNQGYGNGHNGQRAYQANQQADLRFTCKVNARGQVSDLNINRNRVAARGY